MTGDAGTPLTAKWQIIELDEAQGIGSVEIEDGFTLRHEISFHFGDESEFKARNDDFFSSLLELLHEDGIDNAITSRYLAARRFARICQTGSRWWFGLVEHEVPKTPVGLAINDVKDRDFVFSISNGRTMLFTPVLSSIISDSALALSGARVRIHHCKS